MDQNKTPLETIVSLGKLVDQDPSVINWDKAYDMLLERYPELSLSKQQCVDMYTSMEKSGTDTYIEEIPFTEGSPGSIPEYTSFVTDPDDEMSPEEKLEYARILLRDERNLRRRQMRSEARLGRQLDILTETLAKNVANVYPVSVTSKPPYKNTRHEMLALIGDWHIGMHFDNPHGRYNKEIAKARIDQLLAAIWEEQDRRQCDTIHVAALGDMISGNIHKNLEIQNSENVIAQIISASELLTYFLKNLVCTFETVHFTSVAGNHSRITPDTKNANKDERLDDLISWYIRTNVQEKNFIFHENEFDNTIAVEKIFDHEFVYVHGDHDNIDQNGIANIILMLHTIPYAVCAGHYHHFEMNRIGNVVGIRNGSLCSTGDHYTIEKRIAGKAEQTILVIDKNGITSVRSVEFE